MRSPHIKLICLVFLVIYTGMTLMTVVTVGKFLMETTLKSVVKVLHLTKGRLVGPSVINHVVLSFSSSLNTCSTSFSFYAYDSNLVLQTPAGKPLMELVAVDWLKDTKRMDHVARRHGCAVRVRFCCLFHVRLHGVPFSCLSLSSFLKH